VNGVVSGSLGAAPYNNPAGRTIGGGGCAAGLGRVSSRAGDQSCLSLGTTTAENTMFEAANGPNPADPRTGNTGQIAASAISDSTNGMIVLCQEGVKAFYHANFQLDKDEPCGEYKVVAVAVGVGGAFSTMTNYFDVLCQVNLQVDNTTADFGSSVTQGHEADVNGDLNFVPNDNHPTLFNGNNSAMGVVVNFSAMTGPLGKTINFFNAAFGLSAADLNKRGYGNPNLTADPYIPANTDAYMSTLDDNADFGKFGPVSSHYVLCANELGKLDLSIHPDFGLPAGTYTGTVNITGYNAEPLQTAPFFCYGYYHVGENANHVVTPPTGP